MLDNWGVIGCAYMAREYCRVLIAKGITPKVYSRNLASTHVAAFEELFPTLKVEELDKAFDTARNWLVCTKIESHDAICAKLQGRIFCEKPFSHIPDYNTQGDISVLVNRRYYYWVATIQALIKSQSIVKVVACIPEKSADALITQSIHVIDLLWYLTGAFGPAQKIGESLPTFIFSTSKGIPVVVNMNYGSHENFSIRFYDRSGTVYEAKPLEMFTSFDGMEVRQPTVEFPIRTYLPKGSAMPLVHTRFKPGLEELVDDLIQNRPHRLPSLAEHRDVHQWMTDYMQ